MEECQHLTRYISILQRMSTNYYDRRLHSAGLGGGLQFFLLYIACHPGISFQELAEGGRYDKASATRAVQKLEEAGLVRVETDEKDRRSRHLYVTDQAGYGLEQTMKAVNCWADILTDGFTQEEKEQALKLLRRMTANAAAAPVIRKGNSHE